VAVFGPVPNVEVRLQIDQRGVVTFVEVLRITPSTPFGQAFEVMKEGLSLRSIVIP